MSKKSSTFAAESNKPQIMVVTPATYNPIYERVSSIPCDALVPNEAMSIREMLERTSRGQRIDVHTRFRADGIPDNMYRQEFDADGQPLPDKFSETFDHTPPHGMNDIVDVQNYSEEVAERKKALQARYKKTVANASQSAPATPAEPKEPHPDDEGARTKDE